MRADQRRLLVDSRLTDQARIMGLYFSERAVGEPAEVSHDELATVLHDAPGEETIRRHLRFLVLFGYVEKSAGGRGHSDKYLWIDPELCGSKSIDPDICGSKAVKTHTHKGLKGTVVVGSSKEEVVEEETRAREESLDVENLETRALRALGNHGDLLRGCRGALSDYLLLRVARARQYAYVQSIAGWMNGLDPTVWKLPDGSQLEAGDRPGMLAVALNELLAADEGAMKRPRGDPGNLRTKLQVLLRKRGRQPWDGSGMTAAEESNREASRRERAVQRSRRAAVDAAEREIDRKAEDLERELQESKAWFEEKPDPERAEIRGEAEKRIRILTAGGVRRSRVMEEMALLEAIQAARKGNNCVGATG